jgi:hypothetical protein
LIRKNIYPLAGKAHNCAVVRFACGGETQTRGERKSPVVKDNQIRIYPKALCMAIMLVSALAFQASAEGIRKRIKFPKGFSGVTLKGGVIRGETDVYLLKAGKGQTMTVSITSTENNAVFQLYAPNRKTLKGAGETDDAMKWRGKLPLSGDYQIVVGGTRGNATYSITVEVE